MKILQQYFGLQFLFLKRQFTDLGVNPVLGLFLILIGFYGLSFYLFYKTEYACYLYIFIALTLVFRLSEVNRNEFLKFIFPKRNYLKLRISENLITVSPFIIFLCFKNEFYPICILTVLTAGMSLVNTKKQMTLTIPTPFYIKPFEFIVGFRFWFGAFLLAYYLTAVSVIYQNFNLGIFSLILVFLVCFSFYKEPENIFYVWIYKLKANAFLFDKIKTAIIFSTLISLPVTITLLFFFPTNIIAIISFQAFSYCYLSAVILAKYTAYPEKMSLPGGILLGLSLIMPPMLLALIPYFYFQSHRRLKEILE